MKFPGQLQCEVILNDCEYLVNKYRVDTQFEEFRTNWFCIISLLRAVGHVLDKTDSSLSDTHKLIIARKWKDLNCHKPEPRIFHDFIDVERNRILKEYEFGIKRRHKIPVKGDGKVRFIEIGTDYGHGVSIASSPEGEFQSYISSGYYQGHYELDIAKQAIQFWKDYIQDIKNEIASGNK